MLMDSAKPLLAFHHLRLEGETERFDSEVDSSCEVRGVHLRTLGVVSQCGEGDAWKQKGRVNFVSLIMAETRQ